VIHITFVAVVVLRSVVSCRREHSSIGQDRERLLRVGMRSLLRGLASGSSERAAAACEAFVLPTLIIGEARCEGEGGRRRGGGGLRGTSAEKRRAAADAATAARQRGEGGEVAGSARGGGER
jgi:hypothetical protein